jgi:hypothetical protein
MTMKWATETLMAYADGELDAATRAQIEADMEQDAELADAVAAQLEQREALQAKLRAAFNDALQEDVPDRLIAATEATPPIAGPEVIDLARRRVERESRTERRWSWPQWSAVGGAIAASVLLGVIVGRVTLTGGEDPFVTQQGRMLAQGALDSALTEQAGGSTDRETGIQLGVSYLAKNGDYCRTFTLKDEQPLAGLACRRNSQWTIDALARTRADASGPYRMAGAEVPALILGLVEDTIAGDPLDAEQEAEARQRGWER